MLIQIKENVWINTGQIVKMKLTECTDGSFNFLIILTGSCQEELSFSDKAEADHAIREMGGRSL